MGAPLTGRTAVLTDSSAALPPELAEARGITVVPLQVVADGRAYDDGAGFGAEQLVAALRRGTRVSTSRPAVSTLSDAYARLAGAGACAVVSVHLSGALSGTVDSASTAARTAPLPVTVVDSRSLGLGLGFAVLAAARAAADGRSAAEVADAARRTAAGSRVLFYVDTLEHLHRGGRIGAAARLLGSALAVKPLLRLDDGAIVVSEKVRTSSRALARLEDLAVEAAGERVVDLGVHHLGGAERATALAERLAARLPGRRGTHVVEVGAVVGAHVGPGMLAVVVAPADTAER